MPHRYESCSVALPGISTAIIEVHQPKSLVDAVLKALTVYAEQHALTALPSNATAHVTITYAVPLDTLPAWLEERGGHGITEAQQRVLTRLLGRASADAAHTDTVVPPPHRTGR